MNLWETPTFKHRHAIKKMVEPLKKLEAFGSLSVALVHKSGKFVYLSSLPSFILRQKDKGYDRGNVLLSHRFLRKNHLLLASDYAHTDELQKRVSEELESHGNYACFALSRYCPDCCLMVAYNTRYKVDKPFDVYRKVINELSPFIDAFLDTFMGVYTKEMPELKGTRFAKEKLYRKRVITIDERPFDDFKLTNTELVVLYWTAQGKNAEELGIITGYTRNTIDTYRRRLIAKMKVNNITQAVYIACGLGLIS